MVERTNDKQNLINYVRDNIIGNSLVFKGPYGLRKVLYLDYIASGRSLQFIEDYIQKHVLPEYANTHTTTSVTSLQTSLYRQEARSIIRQSCNANENDSVIFVGSGCTGAIDKLLNALHLKSPPIVFIGPFAHHSLFLPWAEARAKVIRIRHDNHGLVDLEFLQTNLKRYASSGRQLIGCFTAASNVTGILSDVNRITLMLHKHGALVFWDYATAAPYVQIDMNPTTEGIDQPFLYKDAIFISPHKFLGGVGTPGILIAKTRLFKSSRPVICGGGTVIYVTQKSRYYFKDPEVREEGGTPAIVESIRAGLTFQLKDSITPKYILEREDYFLRKALAVWNTSQNLVILGNTQVPRLPVFSFLIYHPQTGRFLHHNFVSTILNDVFGIQNRGGCACAGPYAIDLLDIGEDTAQKIASVFVEGELKKSSKSSQSPIQEILKPGFTRLNLPYFLTEDELQFIIKAVTMVAEHGWKLLPQYTFVPKSGDWNSRHFKVVEERKSLNEISYKGACMEYQQRQYNGSPPKDFQEVLVIAQHVFERASSVRDILPDQRLWFDEASLRYRWFLLPSEAQCILQGDEGDVDVITVDDLPFCPVSLKKRLGCFKSTVHQKKHKKQPGTGSTWNDKLCGCFTRTNSVSPIV